MKRLLLSAGLIFLCATPGFSQNKQVDSLLIVLKNAKPDTNKVITLYNLSTLLSKKDVNEDIVSYASEALSISQKENYNWGIGISYYIMGFCEYARTNYEQALNDISNAEKILEQAGDKKNSGRCMYWRGRILYEIGNYPESIKFYTKALQTWQAIGYRALAGECTNNMGVAYDFMDNTNKAIECYYRAMQISEELGDKKTVAQSLQYLAGKYYDFGDYENAMRNALAASSINLELGDKFAFAQNNNTFGKLLVEKGNYTEALQKFYQSLKIYQGPGAPFWGVMWSYEEIGNALEKKADSANAGGERKFAVAKYKEALDNYTISLKKSEEIKNQTFIPENKIAIGEIYFKMGKISIARKYLLNALKLLGKLQQKEELPLCYLYLSKIDSLRGNTTKAYEHYKLYILYRDSLLNKETLQKLSFYKVQSEFEKKEQEIKLLSTENKLQAAIAQKQSQQKKFIYVVAAAILGIGGMGVNRYIRRKKLQNQQEVLKERLRISRELHDELGATLSGIAMYSYVAKDQINAAKKEEVERSLSNMQQSAGEMVNKLNDMVWLVNPAKDSLEKLIERLEEYAQNMAVAKNIEVKIEAPDKLASINLPVESRRDIYLFCKEAINNAVKYSNASIIQLIIKEFDNKKIEFLICDNGKGFNVSTVKKGNGLDNMQQRASDINGIFSIQSEPGEGTSISLTCKIT